MITEAVRYGHRSCLLEGTQGSGLSLIHGPWPYVTSADTNAAQMAADVGLPPRMITKTLLVARTYPIRVAGNSGPMYQEISWDVISERMGRKITEQTTVTKKTRRVGEWDEYLFVKSCQLNAPTSVALTFVDYLSPADEGVEDFPSLSRDAKRMVHYVESLARAPVSLIGTGGNPWRVIDRGGSL
jgi:adenylosuccinate synthase